MNFNYFQNWWCTCYTHAVLSNLVFSKLNELTNSRYCCLHLLGGTEQKNLLRGAVTKLEPSDKFKVGNDNKLLEEKEENYHESSQTLKQVPREATQSLSLQIIKNLTGQRPGQHDLHWLTLASCLIQILWGISVIPWNISILMWKTMLRTLWFLPPLNNREALFPSKVSSSS